MKSRNSRRLLRGISRKAAAVTAGALALAVAVAGTASADGPLGRLDAIGSAKNTGASSAHAASITPASAQESAWSFSLNGRDSNGTLWSYTPNATGGFAARDQVGTGWGGATAIFKNNPGAPDANAGTGVATYLRVNGTLYMYFGSDVRQTIGTGWNTYNKLLPVGNVGGAANPDLLARDGSGVLWLYMGYSNGHFAGRKKVGSGWQTYTQIAGRYDLSGDGRADIVARDRSGVLWLYKGTGSYSSPFTARTRIGSGWNTYNTILSTGDVNQDGRSDLLARDGYGTLYFYAGTGSASAPFKSRQKVGSGWNTYNLLY